MKFYTDESAILLLLMRAHDCGYNRSKLIKLLNKEPLPINFVSFEAAKCYKLILTNLFSDEEAFNFGSVFSLVNFKFPLDLWENLFFKAHNQFKPVSSLFPLEPSSCFRPIRSKELNEFNQYDYAIDTKGLYIDTAALNADLQPLKEEAYRDKVASIMSRNPDEYWRGTSAGFLVVLCGPEVENTNQNAACKCLCRACGQIVSIPFKDLDKGACESCVSEHNLDSFDINAMMFHASAAVMSRQESLRKAGLTWAKENLISLLDREGIGFVFTDSGKVNYPAHSQVIKNAQNRFMLSRWKLNTLKAESDLDTPMILLRWAGFPLTPTDELHRLGHESDAWTERTPYSHDTVLWLPKTVNKSIKRTNTSILYKRDLYPSLESACGAASLNSGTLRQRIRRDKSKTPQQHFNLMVDALSE